jgi:predicted Zn-dependent peptidase
VDKRNHEVNVVLGATAPSLYSGKDRIVAAVLAGILGGPGANSLLNAYLREKKGWVYGVECSYTQYSVSGIMAVSLGCERENLESCLAAVRRIISGLCEKPLSERKMAQARKQLLGQFGIASDNAESQCLSMGKSMLAFGRVASDGETRAAVESVSAADILDMAVRVLTPDRLSSLVYL